MGAMGHTIESSGMASTLGGYVTPMAAAFSSGLATPGWQTGTRSGTGTDLDMQKIGQARNKLMDIKLNQVCLFTYLLSYFERII